MCVATAGCFKAAVCRREAVIEGVAVAGVEGFVRPSSAGGEDGVIARSPGHIGAGARQHQNSALALKVRIQGNLHIAEQDQLSANHGLEGGAQPVRHQRNSLSEVPMQQRYTDFMETPD